ncbi:hypothetical protein OH77DRAFT_506159 [Trametes cingulata]|nr:hypothetical protein OH77DRAFT_506159 [Trametes cingulata]
MIDVVLQHSACPSESPEPFSGPAVEHAPAPCIQRLPPEILVEIFRFYGAERHARNAALIPWPIELPSEHACSWIPLMLICRLWRDIGLDTPTLWREIEVKRRLEWLQLALTRSKDAPLTLIFYPGNMAHVTVPLLRPHGHRIRKLVLPPFIFPAHGQKIDLPFFLPLLRTRLTLLDELVIVAAAETPDLHKLAGRTMLPLSERHYPALRTLRLARAALLWTPSVISRLTCLDLRACVIHGPPLPHDQFLSALGTCLNLVELRLLDSFISFATVIPAFPVTNPLCALPKLRELTIGDEPAVISWFISSLRLPEFTTIETVECVPAAMGRST